MGPAPVYPLPMRFPVAAALLAGALLSSLPSVARAGDNDLALARLGTISGNDVIANNQAFRSLTSELGVVLAPAFLSTADTPGYSGFQFDVQTTITSINSSSLYWCATQQSTGCAAQWDRSGFMPTLGVFVRKGMWIPLPSFEIGAGVTSLLSSSMWAAQAYAKFGIVEGYHDLPLPSIAARGSVSRLMGSRELDLTVASLDASISYSIGVQGTFNGAIYGGWNYLWIMPRSGVIDKTPTVDSYTTPGDIGMDFVFPTQSNITRQRLFLGLKAKYYIFALTVEGAYALRGSSVDDVPGTAVSCDDAGDDQQSHCDAHDKAGSQLTVSTSLAVDF